MVVLSDAIPFCWDEASCWDAGNISNAQTVGATYACLIQLVTGTCLYFTAALVGKAWPESAIKRFGVTVLFIYFTRACLRWILGATTALLAWIIGSEGTGIPPFVLMPEDTHIHNTFMEASTNKAQFFNHVRTEENFLRSNIEAPDRPPSALAPCRERMTAKNWNWLHVVSMGTIFDYSLGLALISSAGGSLLIIQHNYAAYKENTGDEGEWKNFLDGAKDTAQALISNFVFFPAFLLFGYLGYSVTLWRRFVEQGTFIQGRLHDICIMLGGAVVDADDDETRKSLYRIYRYIASSHFLCYKSLHVSFEGRRIDDLKPVGLLTDNEVTLLGKAQNKARDTLVGWISVEVQEGLRKGRFDATANAPLVHAVARFRGYMGQLHDFLDLANPNIWTSNMMMIVQALILILVCGLPFIMHLKAGAGSIPWVTLFGVCLVCLCYWTSIEMIIELEGCFDGDHDVINPDAFLAGSEQTAFALLRARFDDHHRMSKEPLLQVPSVEVPPLIATDKREALLKGGDEVKLYGKSTVVPSESENEVEELQAVRSDRGLIKGMGSYSIRSMSSKRNGSLSYDDD